MSAKVPSNLNKTDGKNGVGAGPARNTRSGGNRSTNGQDSVSSNSADPNRQGGAYAPGFNPPNSFPSTSIGRASTSQPKQLLGDTKVEVASSSGSQESGTTSQKSNSSSNTMNGTGTVKQSKVPSPMRKKMKVAENEDGKMTTGTVFTVGFRDGIQAAFALKSKDQTKHVYSHPLKRIIQMGLSVDAVDKTQICRVVTRRTSPEDNSPMDAGTPISEATRRKFGESFKRHCNVFLRMIPEDKNTKESRKKFGAKVTKAWNSIGSDTTIYTYPETFHYGGDLTPENPSLMQRLGEFVVDEETIGIILDRYHTYEHNQIADDDDLLRKYFDESRLLEIATKIDPGTIQRRNARRAKNPNNVNGDDSSELSDYET